MKRTFLAGFIACIAAGTVAASPSRNEALDFAFRFASAIRTDPKDMSQAQASIVLASAEAGNLDAAVAQADAIEGWRRGTAYADLVPFFARAGRKEEAATFLRKAESVRLASDGWQSPRITAHIAQALAATGDAQGSRQLTAELAASDPRQYAGRVAAVAASAEATSGNGEAALTILSRLDGETDYDVAWWRTIGYLDVARSTTLPKELRQRALRAARRSADGIPGWKSAEALESVAAELHRAGDDAAARAALVAGETTVLATPDTMPMKALLLARLAIVRADVGDTARARELLTAATAGVNQTMVIEQPGILARIASGYSAVGDPKLEAAMYDWSLAAAAALVNARPRALATVEICRALARDKRALDEATRSRLTTLLAGLKDPW